MQFQYKKHTKYKLKQANTQYTISGQNTKANKHPQKHSHIYVISEKQMHNSAKYTLTQFQINKQKWYNFDSKYKHKYIKHFQKHKHIYKILNK